MTTTLPVDIHPAIHDAIADSAEVISGFRVIGDQEDLFGPVASVPMPAQRRPRGARPATVNRRG